MPELRTIWDFKQVLKREGREGSRRLFEQLKGKFTEVGMIGRVSSMVDAPRQHNSREEKVQIKECKRPEGYEVGSAKGRQKTVVARWEKKTGHEKVIDLSDQAPVVERDFAQALTLQSANRLENQEAPAEKVREAHCDTCGGTVVFEGTTISTECPYCGSPSQEGCFHEAQVRIPIDGVLPFMVERSKAKENLKKWVQSRWFAPNTFKTRGVGGKFNGMYMPYWTYDSMTFTRYRGERGEHYYVENSKGERERRTRWYPAQGSFQRFFNDVLVCALEDAKRKLMRVLEPWPLQKVKPFNQESFAGYLAMAYEVELDEGFLDAKGRMEDELRSDVCHRIGGDDQRVHSLDTRHDAITYKSLSLPIWMLAYRYNQKSYQVLVNACTGEVQGERTWSWIKIGLASFALLTTVGLIYVSLR